MTSVVTYHQGRGKLYNVGETERCVRRGEGYHIIQQTERHVGMSLFPQRGPDEATLKMNLMYVWRV